MARQSMWLLGVVGILALGLNGCGSGNADDGQYVTIGTAPAGGTFYQVGSVIASVLDSEGPEAWSVTAAATGGSTENMRLLMDDELDLALSNATITWHAYHLVGEWANSSSQGENLPLANVMTMFPNIALFITPQSSGIEQITDLRGKRVYVGPEGAGFEYFIRPILKSHGMSFDDISPVYGSQQSAVDYLGDGSVDAAMIGGGVPTGSIVQVANAMPIRFIPFDDEAKAELIANYPSYEEATIPGGTYTGVDEDFLTLNVGSAHIMTATDVDEELVYQATKTIFENREEIAKGHPAARAITPTNVVKDFGVPFHPGAIRYYREAGIWPEDGDVQ